MPKRSPNRLGILDIGSNSVRFVVYEPLYLGAYPIFNEKVQCGLGREIDKTGVLHEDGRESAMEALLGFKHIANAMNVQKLHVVGTAALREAQDAKDFISKVFKKTGLKIKVISGEEEARLAALGVLTCFPDAKGVVGDLGGGSLELAHISDGKASLMTSLPLGTLRVQKRSNKELYIAKHMNMVDEKLRGKKTFYAVGGTWRTLAYVLSTEAGVKKVHKSGHQMDAAAMIKFAMAVAHDTPSALMKTYRIEQKRAELLPHAALTLACVLKDLGSKNVIITRTSLRDGLLYDLVKSKKI